MTMSDDRPTSHRYHAHAIKNSVRTFAVGVVVTFAAHYKHRVRFCSRRSIIAVMCDPSEADGNTAAVVIISWCWQLQWWRFVAFSVYVTRFCVRPMVIVGRRCHPSRTCTYLFCVRARTFSVYSKNLPHVVLYAPPLQTSILVNNVKVLIVVFCELLYTLNTFWNRRVRLASRRVVLATSSSLSG